MDGYLSLKLIHILSATLFFGTGFGTAFYMWRTYRGRDTQVIASVASNVVKADWWFTMPAVIIQPITGFWMLDYLSLETYPVWITGSLVLYVLVGLCWLPVVWIQIKLAKLAQNAVDQDSDLGPEYNRYMRIWFALGWPAFTGVLVIFYLMIFRPV